GYSSPGRVSAAAGTTLAVNVGGGSGWLDGEIAALLGNATLPSGVIFGLDTTNGDFSLSSAVTPTLILAKYGANSLTLNGTGSPSAATRIFGGSLVVANAGLLLDNSSVFIGAGGTLSFDGTRTLGSLTGSGLLASAGTVLLIGNDNTSPGVFSGSITGPSNITKIGSGALILSGSNTFTGQLTVLNGPLVVASSDAALGSSAKTVFVGGDNNTYGGVLEIAPSNPQAGTIITHNLYLSGEGPATANSLTPNFTVNSTGGLGALLSIGNNTVTGSISTSATAATWIGSSAGMLTLSGALNLGAGQNLYLGLGFGNTTVNYIPATTGGVKKYGSGSLSSTLILTGSNNAFSGGLEINSGNVRVSNGGALGTNTGTQALNLSAGYLEVRADPADIGSFASKNVYNNNGTGFILDRALGGTGLNQTVSFGSLSYSIPRGLTLQGRNGYGFSVGYPGASIAGAVANSTGAFTTTSLNGLAVISGDMPFGYSGSVVTLTFSVGGDLIFNGSILNAGTLPVVSKSGTGMMLLTGTSTSLLASQNLNNGVLAVNQIGNISGGALNGSSGGALNISSSSTMGALDYFGYAGTGAGETTAKVMVMAGGASVNSAIFADQRGSAPSALVLASNISGGTVNSARSLVLGGASSSDIVNAVRGVVQDGIVATSLLKIGSATWLYSPSVENYLSSGGSYSYLTSGTASGMAAPSNTNILFVGTTTGIVLGGSVSGTNVPGGSVVTQILSGTSIAISNMLTSTVSAGTTLTFAPVSSFSGTITVAGGTFQFAPTATSGNGSNLIPDGGSLAFGVDSITGTGFAGGVFEYQGLAGLTELAGTLSLAAGIGVVKSWVDLRTSRIPQLAPSTSLPRLWPTRSWSRLVRPRLCR
ncbi:MAG: hypothetical protein EBS01_04505, partial [Verrucomicrobia bacterium]|nr:hypothetical protein [Verrucomicrobiota bacterium]